MKNIVCPISEERVPEHLPRVTALYVISLLGLFLVTSSIFVLSFLFIDFLARGFGYSQFSIINRAAIVTSKSFRLKSNSINKAPKIFAARLGTVMVGIALVFGLAGMPVVPLVISILVGVFATLECVVNFCVGCYVYSLIVLPVLIRANSRE